MKAFSRKAIATAAAAGFLTAGAFAAPAMAAEDGTVKTTTTTYTETSTPSTTVTTQMPDLPFNEASSGPEDAEGRFEEWVKLFTAVIGILTTVIGLASQVGRLFM